MRYFSLTQKRIRLIQLINQSRWTIKSAARELGIKLCTAKYILYKFRKRGQVSRRNRGQNYESPLKSSNEGMEEEKIRYVFVPYPVYIYCPVP